MDKLNPCKVSSIANALKGMLSEHGTKKCRIMEWAHSDHSIQHHLPKHKARIVLSKSYLFLIFQHKRKMVQAT